MLTETGTIGSDDWWLMRCATEMGLTFPRLYKLKRHRDGDAVVPEEASAAMREAFVKWARQGRLVMSDLIVTAKTNKQKVIGFRTSAVGDEDGDDAAWANWKRSLMTVNSRKFFNDIGHYGTAYLIVTGSSIGTGGSVTGTLDQPLIVPSNGWNTYSIQYGSTPWLTEAAITIGYDATIGADTITLWRPGYVRTAIKPSKQSTIPTDGNEWTPGTDWTWEGGPQSLGFTTDNAVVRCDAPDGVGFYEKHLDTIDRINETIKQRSTIIAMQAFRQRAIEGNLPQVYPKGHEQEGEPIDYDELFKAGPAALWMIPEGAKIWESAVTDITPILTANDKDIKHLAAVTSTPLYVLSPDAAAGSAAGADLSKEMNSSAVEDLNELADAAFALAQGLAFQAQRDTTRSDPSGIETIYAAIDRTSIIARAAAAPQAKAGGMPQRFIDEMIFQMTPAQIRQARQDRQDEAFDTPVPTEVVDAAVAETAAKTEAEEAAAALAAESDPLVEAS